MTDETKCPKCGIEGVRCSDKAVYVMSPPTKDSSPFGNIEPVTEVHIIDSPACLKRQLSTARARIAAVWKEVGRLRREINERDLRIEELEGVCRDAAHAIEIDTSGAVADTIWMPNGIAMTVVESLLSTLPDYPTPDADQAAQENTND